MRLAFLLGLVDVFLQVFAAFAVGLGECVATRDQERLGFELGFPFDDGACFGHSLFLAFDSLTKCVLLRPNVGARGTNGIRQAMLLHQLLPLKHHFTQPLLFGEMLLRRDIAPLFDKQLGGLLLAPLSIFVPVLFVTRSTTWWFRFSRVVIR